MIVDEDGKRIEIAPGICFSYNRGSQAFCVHRLPHNGERLYWSHGNGHRDDKIMADGLSDHQAYQVMAVLAAAVGFDCSHGETPGGKEPMVVLGKRS